MSAEPLNRAAIEAEIAATAADLAADDEPDEPGHDLGIPGAETVLLLIAGKVVVPILTGLLGKAAGAKYHELRTRRDINAAVAELGEAAVVPVPAAANTVDLETLHREVVAMAVSEGIDPLLAEAVIGKTVTRLHERYFREP